ncbi:hypothetical protein [Paenibacillus polymyxa]|uniref:Uncharacterized protein n=1 Tax=Paenibacillus polymyxa (strain SC2) TaxID=886882 RepID=E3EK79_PAEPS|nr:hypothetical protein [Paenibacillus polymyxa]ADO59788.1 hypothetical protein PPSC2_26220 [Paenibacillus polymyxa SC2]WPQ59976.1 hypothetical protein SKN87_27420 [Paenibacillus polymyxa]
MVNSLREQIAERDKTITLIHKELEESEAETKKWCDKFESKKNLLKTTANNRDEWKRMYEDACDSAHKFQIALEEAKEALSWGDLQSSVDQAERIINQALGD